MAFGWFNSYKSEWYVTPIDPLNWNGYEHLLNVKTLSVKTNGSDDIPKLMSGSMTLDKEVDERFIDGWYRFWVKLTDQQGNMETFPLATLVFEAESGSIDYGADTVTLKGQSVLKPVEDAHMMAGQYIRKGDNGGEWVRQLVGRATPAPVVLDGSGFQVDRNYVFDRGTSKLAAAWKVLDAANWVMQIDGDGTVHIMARPEKDIAMFERETIALFKPGVDYTEDISDVPNVYYARYNYKTVKVSNDDPDSRASTVTRHYVKDVVDTDPILIGGETLEHYANRMLEQSSIVYKTYDYEREVWQDVRPFDSVYINLPGIYTGHVRIISQAFNCGTDGGGLSIEEEVGEEVRLWRAP